MEDIIKVSNLTKKFGSLTAVDDLSFSVEQGKFLAFLGQNGAGKSTTINILIGTLAKDSGEIVYGGNQTFKQFKDKIGVVFQNNIFDDTLSVKENLMLYGRLYAKGKENLKERYQILAEKFQLKEIEKKKFKNLSGGQKRRAELARALFNDPLVLFLDEPTTGLDPKTRIDVWNIIHQIRKESGMTVFLTTHYMEETADADEVIIIHDGKKIAEGSPSILKEKYSCDKIKIVPKNEAQFEKKIKNMNYEKIADNFQFLSKSAVEEIEILNKFQKDIKFFEVIRGSMDDVFLNAVNEYKKEIKQ